MSRKLASIQQIAEIHPIDGADRIVHYRVNDWWVVDGIGKYKVGDLVVYFEIDSLCPMTPAFEFLAARGTKKSELEDGTIVEGYRLRTIRLKKALSQGLLMPMDAFGNGISMAAELHEIEGLDVTELLGVHKYEKPMNAQLRGLARGNFPSFARKSDQERCQNIRREIWDAYVAGDEFQVTVKLDGSSMTVYSLTDEQVEQYDVKARFSVCSRNLDLQETEDNAFWQLARRDDFESKLNGYCERGFAVQGELLAPNIQGNFEGVTRPDFYVYNVFDVKAQKFLAPSDTKFFADAHKFNHVPVIVSNCTLAQLLPNATQDTIIQQLLDFADGPSAFGGKFREGVVFKRTDGQFSFKAISNSYLLKEKD